MGWTWWVHQHSPGEQRGGGGEEGGWHGEIIYINRDIPPRTILIASPKSRAWSSVISIWWWWGASLLSTNWLFSSVTHIISSFATWSLFPKFTTTLRYLSLFFRSSSFDCLMLDELQCFQLSLSLMYRCLTGCNSGICFVRCDISGWNLALCIRVGDTLLCLNCQHLLFKFVKVAIPGCCRVCF